MINESLDEIIREIAQQEISDYHHDEPNLEALKKIMRDEAHEAIKEHEHWHHANKTKENKERENCYACATMRHPCPKHDKAEEAEKLEERRKDLALNESER